MRWVSPIIPLACAAFGLVSAQPLEQRGIEYKIYAYGDNISGLQVYYSNGLWLLGIAMIGDSTESDETPIYLTVSLSDAYTWVAHANSSSAAWTTKLLYMANSGTSEVGFTLPDNTSGKLTDVWWTYGNYVMVNVESAVFYAEPVLGSSGMYTLSWSNVDQSGTDKVLVTLRTIAPSTDSVLS
ncbi:hypothetical protein N7486_001517 [Penicillium sp. IBT 16267x]|nr:hypothetical protein N7486_001517 [Penicillium sp. IBT 16267x]